MRTQAQAQAQDQSSARPRVAGRFLQFLLLLLSTGSEPGVAMAQVPVQTDYRYDPAGNLKSVNIAPASALPTLKIVRSPKPMRVGEPARVDWVATDAVSLTQSCVPSGGGVAQVLDKPLTGAAAVQVSATWVAAPPTCTWTATNARGQVASFVEVLSTVAGTQPAPSVSASYSPNSVRAGDNYTLITSTSNAATLTFTCTGAYSNPTPQPITPAAYRSVVAQAKVEHIGATDCSFVATAADGRTATTTARQEIKPPLPTVSVSYSPNPVSAGQYYTLRTSSTNASSLSFTCVGKYSNPVPQAITPVSDRSITALADANYVGDTTCSFVATAANGEKATAVATQTIQHPQPTVYAAYSPNPVKVGQTYTLTTSSSNATALTFTCIGAYSNPNPSSISPAGYRSVSATADSAYKGATTCTFVATGAGGSVATSATQIIEP